ncbi:hypothetical protein Tco_0688362 [Tanacetum coccineum]
MSSLETTKIHERSSRRFQNSPKVQKLKGRSLAFKRQSKESMMKEVQTSGRKTKSTPWRCEDPNHLIGECPKPPRDKNQRAFVGGSWSDSGEEDDEKVKDETCLVAHSASSEVCSDHLTLVDENSSIGDLALDNEYDKLCK